MFLDSFTFGDTDRHVYPHRVLAAKKLGRIEFAPITIFFGGNGSGKSMVLNVIARTIGVRRPINSRSPQFIRSEDIMEGILEIRKNNRTITDKVYEKADLLDDYLEGLGDKFRDPDSLEPWERGLLSRLDDGKAPR